MKTYTLEELKAILAEHRKWIESGGSAGSSADLSSANLRSANLRSANLSSARQILRLHVGDPRGYQFIAIWHGKDGWWIYAGCRNFTVSEAIAHWSAAGYQDAELGKQIVRECKRIKKINPDKEGK